MAWLVCKTPPGRTTSCVRAPARFTPVRRRSRRTSLANGCSVCRGKRAPIEPPSRRRAAEPPQNRVGSPLDGIRVLDLSTGIAGPLAGMLLADFGADVIKVEPPGGDPGRALPGFAVWNRNKRSIVIDAETDSGRDRLKDFLAGADILVLNDTDFEMESSALVDKYPRLVVLHMP